MAVAAFGLLGIVIAACGHKSTTIESDGEIKDLGYALFEVRVPKQQTFVVNVNVDDARPGETFILLASDKPPQNAGWFDASARPTECSRGDLATRAELRDGCQLGGEGYLVDEAPGGKPVSLQHGTGDVLQCNHDDDEPCSFYYAVVVAPRFSEAQPRVAHVVVESGSDSGIVEDPRVRQLQ
ncbi:MAG TPA: hypothetical protein VIF62_25825 [Labilithrix sp.]